MRKMILALLLSVTGLGLPHAAAGQGVNATLFGTVSDATGALIPGVEVTASNTDTGIDTTVISNETGTYRFPSLRPGPYEVSGSLAGFQTQTFQLTLSSGLQTVQNFVLEIGGAAQTVDVIVAADELLTTTVQSVADTYTATEVMDLPLVGRNVSDLALNVGGVIGNGGATTTLAGIPADGSRSINLQVDGMTVNNGRHEQGLATATSINPDMIAEVRVVIAAVDVETPGSSQMQIRTKSGTNEFHGSLVWNNENSALNANSWSNNRLGVDRDWFSRNQYTAGIGGPIIQNQTFFFFLFDGQRALTRQTVNSLVLTDTARQGIFRFFPGVNNGNADATPSGAGQSRIAPVVDAAGNPLDWTQIPGATGPIESFSVFGDALNPGDPFRTGWDPTGFMTQLVSDMPQANAFDGTLGDGLNTATHRWTRRVTPGAGGTGADPANFNRSQYNVKIDHDFNQNHRLTGSYIRELRESTNNALSPWPNGWDGELTTDPTVWNVTLTSTLSPTMLGEVRVGRRTTTLRSRPPYHHRDESIAEAAWNYMPVINGSQVLIHPTLLNNHMIACAGNCTYFGNRSPLTTYGGTLSWTRGSHNLKFGGEYRRQSGPNFSPNVVLPHVYGGDGDVPVAGIDQIPGLLDSSETLAENILLSLSGSVEYVTQRFETREPGDTEFLDFRETYFHPDNPEDTVGRIKNWQLNEVNFFVKDDWQMTPNFTLNLGVRYDLMMVPYNLSAAGENWTPGLLGGNGTVFGYSGTDYSGFWSGGTPRMGQDTTVTLIGEGTSYPDQGAWKSDRNNLAPAIGFAWSPDFLGGPNRTTVRGGYQIAYQLPGDSISWIDFDIGNMPGFITEPQDFGDGSFRDLTDIQLPIDIGGIQPLQPIPVTERSQTFRAHNEDYETPYVQTFTLGVTHALSPTFTLDVKYVGTRGLKLHENFDVNAPDIRNNGLLEALEITRAGGDAPLFDQMLDGLNLGGGVVGTSISGSQALRLFNETRNNIANGNFVAVAEWIGETNAGTIQPPLVRGGLLRSSGLFPENFVQANPQFDTVLLNENINSSIYHSLQGQITMRRSNGITWQGTYTWSRNLGIFAQGNAGYRDPSARHLDYTLQGNHRAHSFRSHGTFELPFGPGRLVGGNTTGVLARAIEGWKIGAVVDLTSGAPLNITSGTTVWGTGTPDIAGAFPREGDLVWDSTFGNYFSEGYQRVPDPACSQVAAVLASRCTITALADSSGNIVLQHSDPGRIGTLGLATIEGPGSWDVDMNIQKSIQVDESRSVTIRMDAQNVFNHPRPGNPSLNINSGTFGQINSKTGNRIMQVQVRLDF